MKNKRYYNSLNVLISAFMKGNLKHGSTCNCAIGNMIQACGIPKTRIDSDWINKLSDRTSHEHLKKLPYKISEQVLIEAAFEGDTSYNYWHPNYNTSEKNRKRRSSLDKDGFIGLTEVQETLYHMEDWSHENVDLVKLGKENKKLELV